MEKLISIDLKSDFGFFRKPDANNTVNLSYNMLHKPALLGIFGAIVGLEGYKKKGEIPQYYEEFKDLKVGIEPLDHEKGNFQKTAIKYSNTVGYANNGSTYLTEEATLIKPCYRVYVLLNLEYDKQRLLYQYLKEGKAEYLPYFGKNEFAAWWEKESFQEYGFQQDTDLSKTIKVKTLFVKENIVKEHRAKNTVEMIPSVEVKEDIFMYFERLPKDFDPELFQYNIHDYVLTTFKLRNTIGMEKSLYYLTDEKYYVQLL